MSTILSCKGVTAEMGFYCCDCASRTSGQEIIDGERIYIVKANREEPHRSMFRCQNCEDDYQDYLRD